MTSGSDNLSRVWSKYIDPKSGVLRIVFGMGTRAVDRSDDDYTKIVALNAPDKTVLSREYSKPFI